MSFLLQYPLVSSIRDAYRIRIHDPWVHWHDRREQAACDELHSALQQLGIQDPIPHHFERGLRREARRRYATVSRTAIATVILVAWSGFWAFAVVRFGPMVYLEPEKLLPGLGQEMVRIRDAAPRDMGWKSLELVVPLGWMLVFAWVLLSFGSIVSGIIRNPSAASLIRHPRGIMTTYHPVTLAAQVIVRCAAAKTAQAESRAAATMQLTPAMNRFTRSLLHGPILRGSMPTSSTRFRAAREHARRVVAHLLTAEEETDRAPDQALKKLSAKVLRAGDRYAEGRLGALLDDDLSNVAPIPSRARWVRIGAVVGLMLGLVFTIAAFDLPQAVEAYAIAGVGAIVTLVLNGPGDVLPPGLGRAR
ncbi:hypothetical protein OTB20_18720 [Streptomyces sp. H27-H1]|uniref:hypothetical protein n=1 Tax=Streptomyces sp. H27-H1 TaxID=2996461 RepID=UPI002270DDFD|nr:hypothetical protein [Streptomyces sp. H27-H1]MCY0928191.1 hypothetical protein [Streptomyces sp. H27-H1]